MEFHWNWLELTKNLANKFIKLLWKCSYFVCETCHGIFCNEDPRVFCINKYCFKHLTALLLPFSFILSFSLLYDISFPFCPSIRLPPPPSVRSDFNASPWRASVRVRGGGGEGWGWWGGECHLWVQADQMVPPPPPAAGKWKGFTLISPSPSRTVRKCCYSLYINQWNRTF